MLIFLIITLLSILLTTSLIFNILLWKAGERQLILNEIYSEWISDWRKEIFKTYAHMKLLDDKQMFEKDDEVGVIWIEINNLIKDLIDKTEETSFEEENNVL